MRILNSILLLFFFLSSSYPISIYLLLCTIVYFSYCNFLCLALYLQPLMHPSPSPPQLYSSPPHLCSDHEASPYLVVYYELVLSKHKRMLTDLPPEK